MRTSLAAAALLLLLTACGGEGEASPNRAPATEATAPDLTPAAVADDIGCADVQPTGNTAGLDEVTCTLDGHEVTITNWAGDTEARDGLLAMTAELGFYVVAVTDDITAGAEDEAVVDKIRDRVGGELLFR